MPDQPVEKPAPTTVFALTITSEAFVTKAKPAPEEKK